MGASISAVFLRTAGDVVISATRKFPNKDHRIARRIEGAAMRCAYVALCYASLAPLAWDAAGNCVRVDTSAEAQVLDETELKRLAWRVCHERLSNVDLWHVRVIVGEKLKRPARATGRRL